MEKQPRCRGALGDGPHFTSAEAGGSTETLGQSLNSSVDLTLGLPGAVRWVSGHSNAVISDATWFVALSWSSVMSRSDPHPSARLFSACVRDHASGRTRRDVWHGHEGTSSS